MKQEMLKYSSFSSVGDKILYAVLMSIASVVCAACCVAIYFYILDCVESLLENTYLGYAIGISAIMCCMYLVAVACGAHIFRVSINALCIASCLIVYFLCFSFLDSVLDFQFGWLLVWFGFFVMILPNILFLADKIPIRIFLSFSLVVNALSFGINFLTYGSWSK